MSNSNDDFLGTLGGSLMKDLLADLQVDDNDLSLEQLEKELLSLDQEPNFDMQIPTNLNAASLVVSSHAQDRSSSVQAPPGLADTTDAWSLSLEKFTSLSLQDEFLAADSARQHDQSKISPSQEILSLIGAEDYDIKEKQILPPPPGLGGGVPVTVKQSSPPSQNFSTLSRNSTKENSLTRPKDSSSEDNLERIVDPPAKPRLLPPHIEQQNQRNIMVPVPVASNINVGGEVRNQASFIPQQPNMTLPQGPVAFPPQQQGGFIQPPHGVMLPIQMPVHPSSIGKGVTVPLTGVVVGPAVTPVRPPAWQTPQMVPVPLPPPPQQYKLKIFCNPYPSAPPIPASALASSCMSGRDIAYVVHAILKPILVAGISQNDYYVQYIKKRMGGPQANPNNPSKAKDMNDEMTSRQSKSKEWASGKSVLGHVTKSNVARPRALIATPRSSAEKDNTTEQRQRANLWKSRIYCDQAYQSYQKVVDLWRASPPGGGIPPQVQIHLVKLMKCIGIVLDKVAKKYTVGDEILKLVVKLRKGRTLISRVLEQSLLPPNAAQALLSALLQLVTSIHTSGNENATDNGAQNNGHNSGVEEQSMERLFRATTYVIRNLSIDDATLLTCFQAFVRNGKPSFSTKVRMECLHSLLQKGAVMIHQTPSESIKEAWGNAEQNFTKLLRC